MVGKFSLWAACYLTDFHLTRQTVGTGYFFQSNPKMFECDSLRLQSTFQPVCLPASAASRLLRWLQLSLLSVFLTGRLSSKRFNSQMPPHIGNKFTKVQSLYSVTLSPPQHLFVPLCYQPSFLQMWEDSHHLRQNLLIKWKITLPLKTSFKNDLRKTANTSKHPADKMLYMSYGTSPIPWIFLFCTVISIEQICKVIKNV